MNRHHRVRIFLFSLLYMASLPLLTACFQDKTDSESIVFGVRTGVSTSTKTSYSGVVVGGRERLDWKAGDRIRIASDKARHRYNPSQSWADYKLKADGTPGENQDAYISRGSIEPVKEGTLPNEEDMANGLVWAEEGGTHTFYGLYPAPSWLPSEQQNLVKIEDVTSASAKLTAFLPSRFPWNSETNPVTVSSRTESGQSITTKKVQPDMRYVYMWARMTGKETDKNLNLDFYPMVTTFEVSVKGSSGEGELTIEEIELFSTSCALHGSWTATVSANTPTPGTNPVYGGSLTRQADVNDKITLAMPVSYNIGGEAASTVSKDEEVCFTLFVLPHGIPYDKSIQIGKSGVTDDAQTAITDLYLRFKVTGVGGANQSHYLQLPLSVKDVNNPGTNVNINQFGFVEFPAGKKINIKNITLPVQRNPWTFSVAVDDLEENYSDIVVNPVGIEDYIVEKAGLIDGSMVLTIADPDDISQTAGYSVSGRVRSFKMLDEGSTVLPVPWTIDGMYSTSTDALDGTNQLTDSPFVTNYAPQSTSAGSVRNWEHVRVDYANNSTGEAQIVWLRIRQTVSGGQVAAMRVERPEVVISGNAPSYSISANPVFE